MAKPKLVSVGEAARILGVCPATVQLYDQALNPLLVDTGPNQSPSRIYRRTDIERFAERRAAEISARAAKRDARAADLAAHTVTWSDAMDRLGVGRKQLVTLRATGRIRAINVAGNLWRYHPDDVARLARERNGQ